MIQQMENNEKKFKKSFGCQGDVENPFPKSTKGPIRSPCQSHTPFLVPTRLSVASSVPLPGLDERGRVLMVD